ncbi:MAG: hypothetical protein CMJ78_27730 [Planctomycetaceae bacterium]|nr:hypothetical protein [Planctomycetaceae bacterium]
MVSPQLRFACREKNPSRRYLLRPILSPQGWSQLQLSPNSRVRSFSTTIGPTEGIDMLGRPYCMMQSELRSLSADRHASLSGSAGSPTPGDISPKLQRSCLVSDPSLNRLSIWSLLAWIVIAAVAALLLSPRAVVGDERDDCRQMLLSGQFSKCIQTAQVAIKAKRYGEGWQLLKATAEFQTGRYDDAIATIDEGLKRYSWSIRLRHLGHFVALHQGDAKRAKGLLDEINSLASRFSWRYTDAENLVTLGRVALLMKADARTVLEGFYDRAKRYSSKRRSPHLASGQLALSKHDNGLAAETFAAALKLFPKDADMLYGMARSTDDRQLAVAMLLKTLEANPNHIEAMLWNADRAIDAENYKSAQAMIDKVLAINPKNAEAWAYLAVIANLANDVEGEQIYRKAALSGWATNPGVDHLIGRKLSMKYRFAEGAAYQRLALKFDADHLPARIQLSQDLLRLGQEEEGWKLATAVHESDGYDVATFNLVELHDKLAKFRTIENDHFILRMDAREAAIYGDRVMELLQSAKQTLCEKYGLELTDKITVEVFPDPDDFAVRTFGMPAIPGFLGVCFGRVITANSPASQLDNPSNWRSVLWHEFCHVVTLELTKNKIPRWLSEGISVYEELQKNGTWGQRMNPRYREMILAGEFTDMSDLSSAFMSPKSGLHLQFAYYESALAVEFLVKNYKIDSVRGVLTDLGKGLAINDALERNAAPIDQLDLEFSDFVVERAKTLAPKADWTKPDLGMILSNDDDVLSDFVKKNPTNLVGLTLQADALIEEKRWKEALVPLKKLVELYPNDTSGDSAYIKLTRVYRKLEDVENERLVLEQFAGISADAVPVYLRLLEIHRAKESWDDVFKNADRLLAVNPLLPQPHQAMAVAAEKIGKPLDAIQAYRTMLQMDADDLAGIHFNLAHLLHDQKDPASKRHVLMALEEAPRYREAHKLLLKIVSEEKAKQSVAQE